MPGSLGRPDGGGGEERNSGSPPSPQPQPPPPPPPSAPDGAPEATPAPDDAAAALRLALDQLSALGLGGAGDPDDDGAAAAVATAPPDGPEVGVPLSAVAGVPGPLPLLEPTLSPPPQPPPPPPRPSPPDVFAGFAPHPASLGAPALLAEPLSVIGSRKKSVNMTECVPVPSSEHVAEIVGRQGCKIKALRAKTNTYIKTPVRGEEPVFIVTGRKEDVGMAKREILSAAEHFSVIRATRSKAGGLAGAAQGPPNLPGQTTIQVRVPYRVVGLVVGPKGATIKRIQQRTHTYIVTPGRDKEPVFAVTGMPENVDRAREEIEAHITLRTGAFTDAGPDSDFHANGTDVCLDLLGAAAAGLWAKAPNPGRRPPAPTSGLRGDGTALGAPGGPEAFYAAGRTGVPDASPTSPYSSSGNGAFTFGGDGPGGAPSAAPEDCDFAFDFLALDLTVPAIWAPFERPPQLPPALGSCSEAANNNGGARRNSGATTPRHSPTLPDPGTLGPVGALPWRPAQTPLATFPGTLPSSTGATSCPPAPLDASVPEGGRKVTGVAVGTGAAASGPATSAGPPVPAPTAAPALARECVVCAEGEAMAALVPCGHNLFCMDCAVRICGKSEPQCPACRTPATQAIRMETVTPRPSGASSLLDK